MAAGIGASLTGRGLVIVPLILAAGLLEPHEADDMLTWDHGGGFGPDSSVRIEATDRGAPEGLIRYCARPPFALERLCLVAGRSDQVPPRIHRHRHHGSTRPADPDPPPPSPRPSRWAALLARIHEVLPLICLTCPSPLTFIAVLTDPDPFPEDDLDQSCGDWPAPFPGPAPGASARTHQRPADSSSDQRSKGACFFLSPSGTVTGLVGGSGSGKTTLLRLISGLEVLNEGIIQYGRHRHDSLPLRAIRRAVAVGWQASELLRGSLRSNIVLGVDDAPEARLKQVLAICQLEGLVDSLPEGLDSPVAEWGNTLSGGEQQRLSLARALMRDAPVILLDEITSNLDSGTEERLMPALLRFLSGKTVVLVSHRTSTLRYVDRIVTLSGGRVVIERAMPGKGQGEGFPDAEGIPRDPAGHCDAGGRP